MDILWTPWRFAYVTAADGAPRPGVPLPLAAWEGDHGCVFCNLIASIDYAIAHGMSAAEAEAAAALAELRQNECEVSAGLRTSAARLAAARAQLELNARTRQLLGGLVEAARSRYEAGQANEADVLMAESESARNDEKRSDALRAYSDAQADLNTLLNRPPTDALGRPAAAARHRQAVLRKR